MKLPLTILACTAALAACTGEVPTPAAGGPVTSIASVESTIEGYSLTVRVTNSDTGAVSYGPYCPGRLEVYAAGAWRSTEDDGSICRAVARAIDPGTSITFNVDGSNLSSSEKVRFVFEWIWFNGNGPVGGESVSAPVTLK